MNLLPKGNARRSLIKNNLNSSHVFANKNFVLISISTLVIGIGGKIYELALPLMIYDLSHSPVAMATMRGIELLPNLLLAMFIGVLIDRANIKKWSQWMIFLQIIILTAFYLLIKSGSIHLFHFYFIGFLLMTFSYGYLNARINIVKQSLPQQSLVAANARLSFIETLIGLLGPLLSGVLLSLTNLYNGILLTIMAMCFSLLTISLLSNINPVRNSKKSTFFIELHDGWRELRSNKPLWNITILVIFLNSTIGMYNAIFIYFAKEVLRANNAETGFLLTILGAGGLLGSLLIEGVTRKLGTKKLIGLTITALAIGYLIMFFAKDFLSASISLFIVGVAETILNVTIWVFRQESTPSHLLGRVNGITGSLFKLGAPIVIICSGFLANTISVSLVFLSAFIMNIVIFWVYMKAVNNKFS